MSSSVLGIDIAKQKVEVALLVSDKVKNKSFQNSADGFQALEVWLRKSGIERVQAGLEATGNYREALAIFLH